MFKPLDIRVFAAAAHVIITIIFFLGNEVCPMWLMIKFFPIPDRDHGMGELGKSRRRSAYSLNYVSFIDPLILAVFLPEKVPFAIERRLTKKKFIGLFLPLVETHILDADAPLTLKYFLNHLKNGGKCVIFPELQPTTIGNPMKVSQGVAMIADHTKAKILPINITGTELTPFSRIQHKPGLRFFAKVTINILPATKIVLPDDLSGPKRASAAGRALEKIGGRGLACIQNEK